MPHPIPEIPGVEPSDPAITHYLKERLSDLCQVPNRQIRFPGSQPISFSLDSLQLLESMDFWVCEKSDGVRVLVFIVMNGALGVQETWLVSLCSMSESCLSSFPTHSNKEREYIREWVGKATNAWSQGAERDGVVQPESRLEANVLPGGQEATVLSGPGLELSALGEERHAPHRYRTRWRARH
jgi:hypothetical protein